MYLYLLFLHNHYAIGFLFVLLMIIIIITSPQYLDLWVLIICAKNWASSREYIPSLALPGAAELSHEEVPYLVKEELVVVMGVWFVASASCLSCDCNCETLISSIKCFFYLHFPLPLYLVIFACLDSILLVYYCPIPSQHQTEYE